MTTKIGKSFKIINDDVSDGYHTFDELYEHRNLLFINILHDLALFSDNNCFYIEEHFPAWDLLVAEIPRGQISYHVPMNLRDYYCKWLYKADPKDYIWDGHTSYDVIQRLKNRIS